MGRSARRLLAVLAIAGFGVAMTACGDDDDDDAAPAAEATDDGGDENTDAEQTDETTAADEGEEATAEDEGEEPTTEDEGDDDDGGGGGISEECQELLGDYLEKLEPFVEDVDWEEADLEELNRISEEMGDEFSELDADISDECDNYDFTTNPDDMEQALDIARDRAPGTVAWLEFVQTLSEGFADTSIPDVTMPDVTLPDVTVPEGDEGDTGGDEGEDAGDVPQDCQGAIDYVRGLMDESESMMELNLNELTNVSNATTVISSECTVNEMNEFFSDPAVSAWMSGT